MTRKPYVVALTGGVASGKSTVERLFAEHGVQVYDADQASRAVVQPGMPALHEIIDRFGPEAVDADGQLDRPRMRTLIFTDQAARAELEAIIHPRVRQWMADAVAGTTSPYCIVSIPLLAEHRGHYGWVDKILVVDAPHAVQKHRLLQRDAVDDALADRMIANQASRENRLAIANDVIDNTSSADALADQVRILHSKYLSEAQRDG